ncbi:glycosyltransferase family 39 protein, partial [Micromonospora sp. WMMD882]
MPAPARRAAHARAAHARAAHARAAHARGVSASPAGVGILAAAGLAAVLRLPFVGAGLGMDEGGYAHVAREWSRGVPLYREAWLDRPQGLLLTYRLLLDLDPDGGAIRLGAVVAGTLITLAVGAAGWQLAGRRAGVVAAALYATVGVAPRLEGFTLNGELLAGVPATVAVVAALRWRRHGGPGWLVAAGIAAGAALTMKPSGVDGLTATLAVAAVTTGRRLSGYGPALAGAAGPLALCALHGVTVGWSEYWHALAGYQLAALGGPQSGDRAAALLRSLGAAAPELAALALPVTVALSLPRAGLSPSRAAPPSPRAVPAALSRVRRPGPTGVIMAGWLGGGVVGVNLGGAYWPHYWVQL